MQNNFELPIVILPETPRWHKIWTTIIHLGAVILTGVSAISWAWKLPVLLVVVLSYWNIHGKCFRQSHSGSVTRVLYNEAGEWWLTTFDGITRQVDLLTPCFVHASLVILDFRTGPYWWQCTHVVLTPEIMDSNDLRRLRVRLRFLQDPVAE